MLSKSLVLVLWIPSIGRAYLHKSFIISSRRLRLARPLVARKLCFRFQLVISETFWRDTTRSRWALPSVVWSWPATQMIFYLSTIFYFSSMVAPLISAKNSKGFDCNGNHAHDFIAGSNLRVFRFFDSGTYQKSGVVPTMSPSMDIEVSSNFERFLFDIFSRDAKRTNHVFQSLKDSGIFSVDPDELQRCRQHFEAYSYFCV